MTAILLGLSITVQSIAAWVAMRIASRTRQIAWLLLALAIVMMALRRSYSFYRGFMLDAFPPIGAEAIALGISALMLGALMGIEQSHRTSAESTGRRHDAFESEGYLSLFALGLGLFTIGCTAATGYFAYTASRDLMIESTLDHLRSVARNYSHFVHAHERPSTRGLVLDEIESTWSSSDIRFAGSYLCVVDAAGVLRLHTRDPAAAGTFVGDSPIEPEALGSPTTFSELVSLRTGWSGRYRALNGDNQIAAMSYSEELDSIVAIHVPMRAVLAAVHYQITPWVVEIIVLALVLFPASMLLHRRAHLHSLSKATMALAEVQQSERDLRRSEERYQMLAEVVPVGIFRCDEHGQLIDINRRITEIVGLEREELLRSGWTAAVHPNDRERVTQDLADWLNAPRRDESYVGEMRILRPDGEIRWVMAQARWMDATPAHFVGSINDITAHREAELALAKVQHRTRETQKLQAIGELASGVAHDFGNMLSVIRSATANLAISGHATEVDQIRKATAEAQRVVGSLLTFGGHVATDLKVVSLADVVTEAVDLLRPSLADNIDLRVDLPLLNHRQHVKADPTEIIQTLINLGLNARDAMPDGGELRISVKSRRIESDAPNGEYYATIEVRDTGMGMTPAIQNRIFEPYFSTKAEKGTGLGMSIVHGIVKEHGGWLEVQSTPGRGTSVIVWLPQVLEQEHRAAPLELGSFCDSNNLDRVAILGEGDVQVRALLRSVLTSLGLEVVEASNYTDLCRELRSSTSHALVVVSANFDEPLPWTEFSELLEAVASSASVVILAEPGCPEESLEIARATVLWRPFAIPDFSKTVTESVLQGVRL